MKTIDDVNAEIDLVYKSFSEIEIISRTRQVDRLHLLRKCRDYLSTSPRQEFVEKQFDFVLKSLRSIDELVAISQKGVDELVAMERATDVRKLNNYEGKKQQFEMLAYLLDKDQKRYEQL